MIKRLLVANRSEIAVRIMATASVLGIETVAVYAADDAACGHISRADAAIELPGTGLDLVELGLRVADGATLPDLALAAPPLAAPPLAAPPLADPAQAAPPRGAAIQVRVNTETLRADGTFGPGTGTLVRFQPSAGRGVRVDTAGYPGYAVGPRYDPLLAKVITNGGTLEEAVRRALRALAEFDIAGVPTNIALLRTLLQALLQAPEPRAFDVGWVDAHAAELATAEPQESGPVSGVVQSGHTEVRAPLAGTVVSVTAVPGSLVAAGDELLVIEAMKMEHEVRAPAAGRVPLVAVVSGYCFAGNAALAGACDVIIATPEASLGMGGPAMIEGGGLGVVAPDQVGPMSIQVPNGVVDLLVPDESAAVATARRYLSYFGGSSAGLRDAPHGDQRVLRHLVPENRVRGYEMRPVIEALCDTGSVLELRAGFGPGVLTVLARLGGRAVGLVASNPLHLGGAIDGDAADKATAFLGRRLNLPRSRTSAS